MDQKILDLRVSEQEWVAQNIELAGAIAQAVGLPVQPGDQLDPTTLDSAWSAWLAGHARGQEDPNPDINAFGCALGDWFVRHLGLEWKLVQDAAGTELAVWGREGDILLFPPNLVGKRYVAGTARFFADIASNVEEQVRQIRAAASKGR